MAICTALIIPTKNGDQNIQVITEPLPNTPNIQVEWHMCDENFKPINKGDVTYDTRDEVVFHTELREQSAQRLQLITSHSTNPELNPAGYRRNFSDIQKENGKSSDQQ